jgi:DNA-binding response OmpR family regulator
MPSTVSRRVLLVEDSKECSIVVQQSLKPLNIELIMTDTLATARQVLSESGIHSISLLLVDFVLPDGDGIELISEVQAASGNTPIFLLTSRDDTTSKVTAFSLGADDYIVKPVNPIELRARVDARLKKASRAAADTEKLRKGRLVLQTSLLRATMQDKDVERDLSLTAKQFKILHFLLKNEGKPFSRSELVANVWGKGIHILDRTIDSHICALRKKLGDLGHLIECLPAVGYRFNSEVEQSK